jgi:hypothetical protein
VSVGWIEMELLLPGQRRQRRAQRIPVEHRKYLGLSIHFLDS